MSEELGEITTCYTMTFNRRSKHSPTRFWQALTEPEEVAVWMEAPAKIDLRVGGSWYVDFPSAKDASYSDNLDAGDTPLDGVIFKVEPGRVLGLVWGTSVVQWTIEETDDGCTYTFIHTGCADRGEGEEGLPAGWHGFLDQLDAHVDGRTFDKQQSESTWRSRQPAYLEKLNAALVR